jgi:hypothetical protein
MERLINIDNGGTLTDICVWDGTGFTYTKTLTTPFDLSKCLFDGIAKASEGVFGAPNLEALLHSTKHIRYSTTQGTNALVERKGPRIGLIADDAAVVAELRNTEREASLFDDLIGSRVAVIHPLADEETLSTSDGCAASCSASSPATCWARCRSSTPGSSPPTGCVPGGSGPASLTRSCIRRWNASCTTPRTGFAPTAFRTRCSSTAMTAPPHAWPNRSR